MSNIPPAGRRALLALCLLAPGLLLTACGGGGDTPEVQVSEDPADIDNPDLLGQWVVVERNGETIPADQEVRYQFTAQGDFVRYEGGAVNRARFTFASPDQITIDGPDGATFYDYELRGDDQTLSEPGEGGDRLRLAKLADQDLDEVPPPTAVPEEDSVPADSM